MLEFFTGHLCCPDSSDRDSSDLESASLDRLGEFLSVTGLGMIYDKQHVVLEPTKAHVRCG